MTLALYKQLERDGMQVHMGERRTAHAHVEHSPSRPAWRSAAPVWSRRALLKIIKQTYDQTQSAAETKDRCSTRPPRSPSRCWDRLPSRVPCWRPPPHKVQ